MSLGGGQSQISICSAFHTVRILRILVDGSDVYGARAEIMKRSLFAELKEGFDALAGEREGKLTLLTHEVEAQPTPVITPEELVELRRSLNVSRAILAAYLRTNVRTLENWEQGRSHPNAQAALLIRLVERYPDMWARLKGV